MLVEQLSVAFKCHSAIGNSNDLKEMIHEVLRTFINETYAVYGEFYLCDENNPCKKFDSFGRFIEFDYKKHLMYTDSINLIEDKDKKILSIKLDNGIIFLISKNLSADCLFFRSMFESLLPKLNLSVNACLNVEKLLMSNKLLEKQKEELIKANNIKDDFLANMSHELKTPLNSIIILSSIMKKNKENTLLPKEIKNISIINNSAHDLLDLISDVLDMSKIEAGRINILKDTFDIKEFILDEYEILKPLVKKDLVNFTYEFEDVNFNVYSDKLRLKQILKNLLSNAIKFTKKGEIKISLRDNKNYFNITVKDTGIGIHKNNLKNVFDRFKQIETSCNREFKGTGLGLAISKELATLLNCSLSVESELDKGSIFTLKVPKKESFHMILDEIENKEQEEQEEKLEENIINNKKEEMNILLLHSNSLKLFSFTIALKKHFLVTPFDSTIKLDKYLNDQEENNALIIFDENIENLENLESSILKNKYDSIKLEENTKIESIINNIIKQRYNNEN